MSAFAMLCATSCVKDLATENAGETSTVTFSVATPEIATRAYSDGTTATELQYAVYDADGNYLQDLTGSKEINISTTVELKLTTGNTYSVAFWADSQAAPYNVDFTTKSVSVDYAGVKSNDENLDAFYAWYTFTVTGAQTETVELKRPFAQLNIGTADYDASESAGYVPTISTVTVSNVYSTLNFATGAVDGATDMTFAENAIPAGEVFPVAGYEYLAMNYLLVAADKAQTIDGAGHTLKVTGAGATWDCAIYTNGGIIRNLTVAGAMRGIFTAGQSSDLHIDNVEFKNVIYTFKSDGKDLNPEFGVYVTNSTVNGWTSHSNMHTEVVYTNCSFGEGSGYKYCRPYGTTNFKNCTFCTGYTVDQSQTSNITFTDCIWE